MTINWNAEFFRDFRRALATAAALDDAAPMATPELIALLRELYHDADILRWLTLPQPLFQGAIPKEMIAAGRQDELVRSLRQIVGGVYL